MDVFESSDYKAYLNKLVESSSWGAVSRLADAAGCQRSYFSKVLNGPIHLTTDHASGLCDYLEFSEKESDYFIALLELGRAATPAYRKRIQKKLKTLKDEHENLTSRLERAPVKMGEKEMLYYSAWYFSAIHILVSIPEYQSTDAICKRLQLNSSIVLAALELLSSFGFVKQNGKMWTYAGSELHVPNNSPLVQLHHNNWRQRAITDAQSNKAGVVHFTAVQSVSKEVAEVIKSSALEFIETSIRLAGPSSSEEMVCLTLDFFRV